MREQMERQNTYDNWHSAGMALFQGPWRLEDPREQRLVLREKPDTSQLSPPPFMKEAAKQQPPNVQALDWPQINEERENHVPKLELC